MYCASRPNSRPTFYLASGRTPRAQLGGRHLPLLIQVPPPAGNFTHLCCQRQPALLRKATDAATHSLRPRLLRTAAAAATTGIRRCYPRPPRLLRPGAVAATHGLRSCYYRPSPLLPTASVAAMNGGRRCYQCPLLLPRTAAGAATKGLHRCYKLLAPAATSHPPPCCEPSPMRFRWSPSAARRFWLVVCCCRQHYGCCKGTGCYELGLPRCPSRLTVELRRPEMIESA